jgi:hypothetical protein
MKDQGYFAWPEREDAKGKWAPGYEKFWHKTSPSSDPHSWEPLLNSLVLQYGQDPLEFSIEDAKNKGINKDLKTVPALFELAIQHRDRPKKKIKIFLGTAINFQKSQEDILTPGSEIYQSIGKYLRLALEHNCNIVRRYTLFTGTDMAKPGKRNVDPEKLVARVQNRFLSSFDYALNRQPDSDVRGVYLVPHNALCCIPAGVDVLRVHKDMVPELKTNT